MKVHPLAGLVRRSRFTLLVMTLALVLGTPVAASASDWTPATPDAKAATSSLATTGFLAVPVNFAGGFSTPAAEGAFQPRFLGDFVRSANPWFAAVSEGAYAGEPTSALEPVSIQPREQLCTQPWRDELHTLSDAAIRARGFEPNDYKAVVYYFPLTDPARCNYTGFTHGNRVIINGGSGFQTLIHELGHTLGLGHAGSRYCTTANGVRVTLSDFIGGSCTEHEYGDVYSAMGVGLDAMTYGSAQLEQLGWNAGKVERLGTTTPTVTKFLTTLENDVAGSTEALRVDDSGAVLWLEYRTPTGVDTPFFSTGPLGGLLVRLETTSHDNRAPFLLDMTPEDDDHLWTPGRNIHPEMRVGQTWVNPRGNLSFTLNSTSPFGASVTITQLTRPVPDLRGLRSATARTTITTAGFVVGSTTGVTDALCESVGKVISQTPVQGTRLLPGRVVDFTFGVAPVRGCPGTQQ